MNEHWKKYTAELAEAYAQAEPFVQSATPQPRAPVVACKAPTWCGKMRLESEEIERLFRGSDLPGVVRDGRYRCTECRHPALPLVAQPAEAKLPNDSGWCEVCLAKRVYTASCEHAIAARKPAEQPKPAAKRPVCGACNQASPTVSVRWMKVNHAALVCQYRRCDPCYLANEHLLDDVFDEPSGILRDPAIPERIAKPQMAHIANCHDDDLIGGAR
jgi:hypothetical protein